MKSFGDEYIDFQAKSVAGGFGAVFDLISLNLPVNVTAHVGR
jgi:hypothetical protein